MDSKTLLAIQNFNLSDKHILSQLQNIKDFTDQLFQNGTIRDISTIQQAITTLHALREKYPHLQESIHTTLFDIQKKSLTSPNLDLQQVAVIPFLVGFEQNPVQKPEDAKKLIQAMSTIPNPEYQSSLIQRILLNLSNDYQKYFQQSDTDMSMARMLRDFSIFFYFKKAKKNSYDINFIYQVTNSLAEVYPFEEFMNPAQKFQPKETPPKVNTTKLPKDSENPYVFSEKRSCNRISNLDDRD